MKNNRNFILLFSLILLLVFLLTIILLNDGNKGSINGGGNTPNSNNNSQKNGSNNSNNGNSSNNNSDNENLKLSTERDYQNFFNINNIINHYYRSMNKNDKEPIFDMLDKDYKSLYGIKKSNINDFIVNGGFEISYFAKRMYRLKSDNKIFFFVNGEEQYDNYITYDHIINDNVEYLVILDGQTNSFSITPLKVDSLLDYAQRYKIKNDKVISKTDYNSYINLISEVDDEMISLYYLSYFKSMLMHSPERAYELLSNAEKSNYNSKDAFILEAQNINNGITSTILNYAVSGKDSKRVYKLICMNKKKITFEETNIMDYKVTLS